jgi:ferredoxin
MIVDHPEPRRTRMRVTVDRELCQGHTLCNSFGPDVYRLDDEGRCLPLEGAVPAELESQSEEGARACPERAISVEE